MRVASYVEQAEQIEELAVNITKDFDWGLQVEQHGFRIEHFDDLVNQKLDRLLVEFYRLTPGAALDLN